MTPEENDSFAADSASSAWLFHKSEDPFTDFEAGALAKVAMDSDHVLIVRCKNGQLDVYVEFKDYLSENDLVLIRFDKDAPFEQNWLPGMGKTALFCPFPDIFVHLLLTKSRFAIRTIPYNSSPTTAIFDISNFREWFLKLNRPCINPIDPPELGDLQPIFLSDLLCPSFKIKWLMEGILPPKTKVFSSEDRKSFSAYGVAGWEEIRVSSKVKTTWEFWHQNSKTPLALSKVKQWIVDSGVTAYFASEKTSTSASGSVESIDITLDETEAVTHVKIVYSEEAKSKDDDELNDQLALAKAKAGDLQIMNLNEFLDTPNEKTFALTIGRDPDTLTKEGELRFGPAYGWMGFKFQKDKCSFIPAVPIPGKKILEYFKTVGLNYVGEKVSPSVDGHCIATDRDMLFCMTLNLNGGVTAVDLFFAPGSALLHKKGLYFHNGEYVSGDVLEERIDVLIFRRRGEETTAEVPKSWALDKYIMPSGRIVDLKDPPGSGTGGDLNLNTVLFTEDERDAIGLYYLGTETATSLIGGEMWKSGLADAKPKLGKKAVERGACMILVTSISHDASTSITGRFYGVKAREAEKK